ncbi:aminotransferase class IV family protein [Ruegeria arenilitoris]|uniref:aminotransferase class IV family protein n=1 Tax=Ruegeria arenilitoris TaxID=1173585 RepID=UPI00147C8B3B|nr:aminotransferase class IV family protein [Ruegeria arenilitoris]
MESPLCPPAEPDFRLIETLAFRPKEGFIRRDRHLARMSRSAATLRIPFDKVSAVEALSKAEGENALRCRLTLDTKGNFRLTTGALAGNPCFWQMAISKERLNASDFWLRHKTTRRHIYDAARASLPSGVDEMLFLNERGELCEGTISNLFLETPDGCLLTPTDASGVLPGILREELIDTGQARPATLRLSDLQKAKNVYAGNSLRGLIRAELVTT